MIGIDPAEQREALEHDTDVVMHLLLNDEPISVETTRYKLVNARCQLRPYSDPCFEVAVAAITSPAGPRIAGKHSVGLLSVGTTMQGGFDGLSLHWGVIEQCAREVATVAYRGK